VIQRSQAIPSAPRGPVRTGGERENPSPESARAFRHRALSAPVRLRILALLRERSRTVSQVASDIGTSVSAASRHLGLLARAGLVERRRRGMKVVCSLSAAGMDAAAAVPIDADPELQSAASPASTTGVGLANLDPDDVHLYLVMGVSCLHYGGAGRTEWRRRMVRLFGDELNPHLDLLHTAALRITDGEPLDGLPLPTQLLRDGVFGEPASSPSEPFPPRLQRLWCGYG
jgi:DNA-binding transcriptional ArsR family regulator